MVQRLAPAGDVRAERLWFNQCLIMFNMIESGLISYKWIGSFSSLKYDAGWYPSSYVCWFMIPINDAELYHPN